MSDDLLRRAREASRSAAISAEDPPDSEGDEGEVYRYPVTSAPTRFAFGEARLCPRCHGLKTKTSEKLGYIPDPEGGSDAQGRKRCVRCNGWGYVPNKGV